MKSTIPSHQFKSDYLHLHILETDRLILRPLKREDSQEAFKNWSSDPNVAKYTTWEAHKSEKETKEFIDGVISNYNANLMDSWGIILKASNRLIGTGGYTPGSKKGNICTIGYALSKKYWNRGIMTEAVRKMVEYGFSHLQPSRIQSYTNIEHIASQRVLEKIGFKFEGVLRNYCFHHGIPIDVKMFSILASEVINNEL